MQKKVVLVILFILLLCIPVAKLAEKTPETVDVSAILQSREEPVSFLLECRQVYDEMGLEGIVNYKAFEEAYQGYTKLDSKRKDIFTLIDFSKASTEERLYVLDMENRKLLFVSHVSHGKNSGGNYATSFSNVEGSNQSSLGFYETENTYTGKNGYSLILNGLEKGINHRAKERAIVVHGADYSNPSVIKSTGRLGRSLGCPALPRAVARPIIDTIKDGTLMYIYADNTEYVAESNVVFPSDDLS